MENKLFLLLVLGVLSFSIASACDVKVALVNQDPYPAMPSDYVKAVFQVSGLESADCGTVDFWLDEKYPFSLDPGAENKITMKSGTYLRDYQRYFLVPYNLRIDENALDGDNNVTIYYSTLSSGKKTVFQKSFNINVEDSRTDFETYVKDYSVTTKEVTIDILNIGEKDVEGLTIELPKQENAKVSGSNRVIIGDLNSNEDDSATFTADLNEGDLSVKLYYTDQIGVRRNVEKTVHFDLSLFESTVVQKGSFSPTLAFIIGFLIPVIFMYVRKRVRKRKEKAMKKKGMAKF